jgi:hypothetical protein
MARGVENWVFVEPQAQPADDACKRRWWGNGCAFFWNLDRVFEGVTHHLAELDGHIIHRYVYI